MNPRRVHDLMRRYFPKIDGAEHEWVVVVDEAGLRREVLEALLGKIVPAEELIVEVHRKIGGMVPRAAAIAMVAKHVGRGDIRIADRKFTGFLVVLRSGVATGWTEINADAEIDYQDETISH
ncbi:hypothetical protein [Rhizobacter sp. Root404]|uniref:hypothetical protein n=1 Tax=Rhizobacter sp. Root404 TaxID=1736528 RepID=UPI0012FCDAD3|nr:hypothetical protein [Rhizobacter sp. Root404]